MRLILTLRRLGLSAAEAGRLAASCDSEPHREELDETLELQRRRIAQQREELERLEFELADLRMTIAAATTRELTPSPEPITVLFVCNGNSSRSQIGEALLDRLGAGDFEALSAGTRPKSVHPLAVRVLAEVGIDWSDARAKPVDEVLERHLDYVITLSDSAREECPAIPGRHSSLHWHLDDRDVLPNVTDEELLETTKRVAHAL